MPRRKKILGADAVCSVLLSYLRPSAKIDELFPNRIAGQRLDDLVAVRTDNVTRSGNTFLAVFFRSESIHDVELHASKRYTKVVREGPQELFWNVETPPNLTTHAIVNPLPGKNPEGDTVEDYTFTRTGDLREDIAQVRAQGLEVDDDNEPAPENVPTTNISVDPTTGLFQGQRFHWNGACQRKLLTNQKLPATFNRWSPMYKTMYEMWCMFFPLSWLVDICIKNTSKSLMDAGHTPTNLGELTRFFGLWFLMASVVGFSRRDFFSSRDYHETDAPCPYRLSKFMSLRRFELILEHLRLSFPNPPTYRDKFWEVREIIQAWRSNMSAFFRPSWIVCLDESMSIWTSRWTCPGWVFCPRKPHPFGNEYHTICCGETGILFDFELVEGKDRQQFTSCCPKY
jgi:hypothetical protein